jgi:hypothetical protein
LRQRLLERLRPPALALWDRLHTRVRAVIEGGAR